MVSLGAAFAMLWIVNEPEGAAAPPPATPAPNAELELSTEPNYLGRDAFVGSMPTHAEASVPVAPSEPAKLETADPTNRRPAASEGRPRRRAAGAEPGARERSKEHRRSKLIDPYE